MKDKHEFTLEEVLQGKATQIKNKEYFKTADYINPFLDRMSKYTSDFRVQVKEPDQITLDDKGEIITKDITFNRVWIQAVLPGEYAFDNHQQVVGMVYGLDCRKPICKIYQGALNMACTNLCVFSPNLLDIQEILPETAIDYSVIKGIMERTNNIKATLEMLHKTPFFTDTQSVNESLGRWVRNCINLDYSTKFGKVKFAVSDAIDAYKLMFGEKITPYSVEEDSESDMLNVYNAFTQIITNDTKDIMNRFEKTLLVKSILGF